MEVQNPEEKGMPLTPESYELVKSLIVTIEAIPDSEPFHVPVDWEDLDLPDYPNLIKNPMDLGTLKKNIDAGKYSTFEQCFKDLALIWDNCKAYNYSPDMYKLA